MNKERLLSTYVTLPGVQYAPDGACVAWVESRDDKCGNTTDFLLCPRHVQVAQKRLVKDKAARAERQAKHAAKRSEMLPKWRERLARIETRIKQDRKSTRLNSSHVAISYAVFCLKKKKQT